MQTASARVCGLVVWAVAAGLAGCCQRTPAVLHMASPQDRYDHNRQQPIVSPALRDGHPTKVSSEVYTPVGKDSFPVVQYASPSPSPSDGLPAGSLVPIFTGVPLPLSADGNPNDRADLIDYLATGPDAQDGVEQGAMSGGTKETERHFKAVLDLLSAPQQLGGGAPAIQRWASARGVTWTQSIVDARYEPSAFADRIAVYCAKFWFVLYRLPQQDRLSRLVVLPVRTTQQDFEGKQPVGEDGSCGDTP